MSIKLCNSKEHGHCDILAYKTMLTRHEGLTIGVLYLNRVKRDISRKQSRQIILRITIKLTENEEDCQWNGKAITQWHELRNRSARLKCNFIGRIQQNS